jgi:hypothetical protein
MRLLSFVASFGLIVALSVGSVGCKKSGTNNAGSGSPAAWGTLSEPSEVKIKKGKTATLKVSIDRKGDKKDDEVTIKVTPPAKITVSPTDKKLGKADTSAEFTLTAEEGATTGEATVAATPGDQTKKVKVTVE